MSTPNTQSITDQIAQIQSELDRVTVQVNALTTQRMSDEFNSLSQIQRDAITGNFQSISQYASALAERIGYLKSQLPADQPATQPEAE